MSARVDPFTLEVIRNMLTAIAEEMSLVVMRAARSPLLREAGRPARVVELRCALPGARERVEPVFDSHGATEEVQRARRVGSVRECRASRGRDRAFAADRAIPFVRDVAEMPRRRGRRTPISR